jgi:hypothetical protein
MPQLPGADFSQLYLSINIAELLFLFQYVCTDLTENVSPITACSIVAVETTCPQSCFPATAVLLSQVYTDVIRQWVYMSQCLIYIYIYIYIHKFILMKPEAETQYNVMNCKHTM